MKCIKRLVLAALLLGGLPVHAAAPLFGSNAETSYAIGISPPPGKSLVYIYQRTRDGRGATPKIWMNNYEIGRLVPGAFTVWQLAPGQLDIRVDGTQPANLSIISEAGKVYLIRVSVIETSSGLEPELTSLPASYRSDMIGTQLIKNPRQLTDVASAPPPAPAKAPSPQVSQTTPQTQSQAQNAPKTEAQTETKPESKPVKRTTPVASTYLTPGGMTLLLKTGSLTLASEEQTIGIRDYRFDTGSSGVYDIELYYQFESGFSIGGELIGYSNKFAEAGVPLNTGTVDTTIFMGTIRQFFSTESSFQPFIGAGLGVATTDVSGTLSGSTADLAFTGLVGIEYRGENVGVVAEYRFISADTEDSNGAKIDVSASGIFAGLAIHF